MSKINETITFTNGNYFCSSIIRPDCLRKGGNQCCLYCDLVEKCITLNKSKTKPCSAYIVSTDEFCPYSV